MSKVGAVRLGRRLQRSQILTETCTIATVTTGVDAGGAPSETETTTTAPCAFWEVSGDEAQADMVRERGKYRLALGLDTTIGASSRITFGTRSYRVVWTPPPTGRSTRRIVGLEDL